jgi:hypothetical protein
MAGAMFNKYHAIFRSRWKALWWACGICLLAYCTVPSAEQTAHEHAKNHAKHVNPWAIQKKAG